jgi:hypothetical protein
MCILNEAGRKYICASALGIVRIRSSAELLRALAVEARPPDVRRIIVAG